MGRWVISDHYIQAVYYNSVSAAAAGEGETHCHRSPFIHNGSPDCEVSSHRATSVNHSARYTQVLVSQRAARPITITGLTAACELHVAYVLQTTIQIRWRLCHGACNSVSANHYRCFLKTETT